MSETGVLRQAAVKAPRTCIIVVGMHRSGTSALTRVINLLGADITRDLMSASVGNNERGFWESNTVRGIHDRLLAALGSSYDDPMQLPPGWLDTAAAMRAKRELADEIAEDFAESALFVVKDPRIARLLPLWLALLDELAIEPAVVVSVRNPLEVAASLHKRDGVPPAQSMLVYVRSYLEVELASRGCRRLFIRYDRLLDDWRGLQSRLESLLGPSWPRPTSEAAARIERFLDPDLRHHKASREELEAASHVAPTVVEMLDLLCTAADTGDETGLRAAFDRLSASVAEATRLFQGLVAAERDEIGRLERDHDALAACLQREIASLRQHAAELQQAVETSDPAAEPRDAELGSTRRRRAQASADRSAELATARPSGFAAATRAAQRQRIERARWAAARRMVSRLRAWWRQRSDRTLIARAGLLDADWYLETYPDIRQTGLDPLAHYVAHGAADHRDPNPLFATSWYLDQNPDVRRSGENPLVHYLRRGAAEGRDPSPFFNTAAYAAHNPDVARAGINPLAHYLRFGAVEGRGPRPSQALQLRSSAPARLTRVSARL